MGPSLRLKLLWCFNQNQWTFAVCITHHKSFPKICVILTFDRNSNCNSEVKSTSHVTGRCALQRQVAFFFSILPSELSSERPPHCCSSIISYCSRSYWLSSSFLLRFTWHWNNISPPFSRIVLYAHFPNTSSSPGWVPKNHLQFRPKSCCLPTHRSDLDRKKIQQNSTKHSVEFFFLFMNILGG